jgi:hypothetical protein
MGRVDYAGAHTGVIVPDPDPTRVNNNVLKLQDARSGGDIITLPSFNPPDGILKLKLEFMGDPGQYAGSGAFIGLTCGPFGTGVWNAATYADASYPGVSALMTSDNAWHTVQFTVQFPPPACPSGVHVVFEDFVGSTNKVFGNDNWWDNIEISYDLPPCPIDPKSKVHRSEARLTKAQEIAMRAEFAAADQYTVQYSRPTHHLLGMVAAAVGTVAVIVALVALVVHSRRINRSLASSQSQAQPSPAKAAVRDVECPQSPTMHHRLNNPHSPLGRPDQ